jgi:hypothetical protein
MHTLPPSLSAGLALDDEPSCSGIRAQSISPAPIVGDATNNTTVGAVFSRDISSGYVPAVPDRMDTIVHISTLRLGS